MKYGWADNNTDGQIEYSYRAKNTNGYRDVELRM
jgi:hypothetical protein